MCAASAIGVHDNLTSGKTCVAMRASDDEFSGRIHMKDEIAVEKSRSLCRQCRNYLRQKDFPYVFLDLVVHCLVHSLLTELAYGFIVPHLSELRSDEFVVLGGNNDGVYAYRVVVLVILDGELGFRVRSEVWHEVDTVLPDVCQNLEGEV